MEVITVFVVLATSYLVGGAVQLEKEHGGNYIPIEYKTHYFEEQVRRDTFWVMYVCVRACARVCVRAKGTTCKYNKFGKVKKRLTLFTFNFQKRRIRLPNA